MVTTSNIVRGVGDYPPFFFEDGELWRVIPSSICGEDDLVLCYTVRATDPKAEQYAYSYRWKEMWEAELLAKQGERRVSRAQLEDLQRADSGTKLQALCDMQRDCLASPRPDVVDLP